MKIISVANHKGGVSKTCTVHNLGKALSLAKKKVLLVDCDAQANLSQVVGMADAEKTLVDALKGKGGLPIYNIEKNLDIVPANLGLGLVEEILRSKGIGGYNILGELLKPLDYDYVLLDCPPSVSIVVSNAFIASTSVLIPVVPESGAIHGLDNIFTLFMDCLQLNDSISIEGILFTRVKSNTALHKQLMEQIKENYQDAYVFTANIREGIALAETSTYQSDIFEHAPNSYGAQDYKQLAKELINKG
ncbi:MAG: ParA family protein [Candidatus Gracilibacteria bacterium]|nr:ParA family protein [Candidatus Gracilibacteria bacterium]